jgi:release factor glutamine methyltransferase
VETVVARCAAPPGRVLDLGTGSGAIALALAKAFPESSVVAADRSAEALSLAAENAESTGLASRIAFVESDWFERISGGAVYDLIVSNPPYLSVAEAAAAAPEVRAYEPVQALTSGADGFTDLGKIIAGSMGALAPAGMLALETGIAHHAPAAAAARAAGFSRTESLQDLTGRDRFFLAWR